MKPVIVQIKDFIPQNNQDKILQNILKESQLNERTIKIFGKEVLQPRLIGFQSEPNMRYSYSGKVLAPDPWSDEILQIRRQLTDLLNLDFNSCLINYYRDGNDSMGWHADDEKELGSNPTIASISLGANRPILFKGKKGIPIQPFSLSQPPGSLLLMVGESQNILLHSVSKNKTKLPRLNLTFRIIKS